MDLYNSVYFNSMYLKTKYRQVPGLGGVMVLSGVK